ncbi:MAG: cation:proton antiporter [Acidobacteria bacterium]|nr:cation:proton antiporter [Acidobacteriota bacterium]
MGFDTLALIAVVGLAGPLLALNSRWRMPVVLGELAAGILLGKSGLHVLHSADPTFTLLGQVGFALMMFVAGSHVPMRDAKLRSVLGVGGRQAGLAALVAVGVGWGIAALFGTGHAPLYVVLLASSSAALVLPIVTSLRLRGPNVLAMTAQVALADIACIIALPLAIDPPNAGRAAIGALAVGAAAVVLFLILKRLETTGVRRRLHRLSEERKFALELRIQLSILFLLAAVAIAGHVSVMLAGFSFGLAVAAVGEPRRLAHQLFAINDGFLGPLFYIWLGSSLDVLQLGQHPAMVLLGIALGFGTVVVHAVNRVLGQPLSLAVLSCAQLGVPVAAAAVGSTSGVLLPGEASALILGALISIGCSVAAGSRAAGAQSGSGPGKPRPRARTGIVAKWWPKSTG